ncbi:hypothetical protein WA026_002728 [Henosepilachna vigintioctopunctata]|uniref:F-box domain-containing protein n=1 Tax=Henosepilachna vigintioctopunctata TaxID=420089 RepID=A0AAW1U369_9CUCU
MCASVSLMDFSDCLMLNLLKYLDSSSLYHLTKVNKRFETLVLDSCLWKKIDARDEPNSKEKIKYCLERMNKSTSLLCLRGENANLPLLTEIQFDNFPNHLTILALENQNIDQPSVSLNNFPSSLVELSFKNSAISNSSYFFKRTFEKMENLRVLLLDGCSLINSSVVMSVSKYHKLEILSFYKCQIENSIPYFSIAAWHGFKKLRVLDVRLSGLGNPFLKSMIRCTNIISFYFQNMDTSYVLDFKNRKYELETSGGVIQTPQVEFTLLRNSGNEDTLITDKGTAELRRTSSSNESSSYVTNSFLYTDPYGACTCGFADSLKDDNCKLFSEGEDSDVSVEGSVCDLFESATLEKHLDFVERARDRQQIKEYPVNPNQEDKHAGCSKRKDTMNSSQKQPLKKRKRISEDFKKCQNDFCTSSVTSVDSTNYEATSSQTNDLNYKSTCCCQQQLPNTTIDEFNSKRNIEDGSSTQQCGNDIVSNSPCKAKLSSCTLSNVETIECVENRDSMHSHPERSVPLKKRKLNEPEDAEDVEREPSIEISWRNELPTNSSSSCQCGSSIRTVYDKDGSNKMSNKSNIPMCSPTVSINSRNPSFDNNVPSTSGTSKCDDSSDSEDEPSTSRDAKNNSEENSTNEIHANQENRPGTPPENPPYIGMVYPQNEIGVIIRNRLGQNRNILQICIRGNRNRNEQLVQEDIEMGIGVDLPSLMNAVRMINFVIPPDQQDVELVNLNMNVNMNRNRPYQLSLKRLSFRGYTKVTDLTLSSIEHLNLELLDLTYTRVTKRGILTFLRVNPNCRVLHKEFCICKPNLHF